MDNFILQLEAAFFAETIDMLVLTKYFLLRHKDNKFLDILSMFLHEIINCTLFILLQCAMNTFV